MGRWLGTQGPWPELVLSSTATRTRQTWERLARAAGHTAPVTWDGALYLASVPGLLERIAAVPAHIRTLMVLGHNPGLHELAVFLIAPSADDRGEDRLRRKLPTGALVQLDLVSDEWAALTPASGRLIRFIRPKDLPDPDPPE